MEPPIPTVIPEITQREFLDAARQHMQRFGERIKDDESRGAQAYAILAICRGMYTLRLGGRPSKIKAAAWAAHEFSRWAQLIESALVWRKEQATSPGMDKAAAAKTRQFVAEMTSRVVG